MSVETETPEIHPEDLMTQADLGDDFKLSEGQVHLFAQYVCGWMTASAEHNSGIEVMSVEEIEAWVSADLGFFVFQRKTLGRHASGTEIPDSFVPIGFFRVQEGAPENNDPTGPPEEQYRGYWQLRSAIVDPQLRNNYKGFNITLTTMAMAQIARLAGDHYIHACLLITVDDKIGNSFLRRKENREVHDLQIPGPDVPRYRQLHLEHLEINEPPEGELPREDIKPFIARAQTHMKKNGHADNQLYVFNLAPCLT